MSQTKAQLVSGTTAQDLTVDNINTTSINSGQPSGRKNIIINGAMNIAQRGTSSTSTAYQTVDRFRMITSGVDEAPTQAQADVASGTTPYTLGFRKSFKITNGDQTSVGAADFIKIQYRLEAQDIANSGWNYVSSSSYITLSFWVKSSIAQNFYGYLETSDGSTYLYPFETGSLTADTWTKVTKTISGNSNLVFNNDNGQGLQIEIQPFMGTDSTASGVSLNQWNAYAAASRTPDQTSTWYTTNDATLEITGVQLEVGSTASDFEHRSFGEELALCQRYFFIISGDNGNRPGIPGFANSTSNVRFQVTFPNNMRALPSITGTATNCVFDSSDDSTTFQCDGLSSGGGGTQSNPHIMVIEANPGGMTAGQGGHFEFRATGSVSFSSEL
jgi:hypothetical protein